MDAIKRRLARIDFVENDTNDKGIARTHVYANMLLRLSGNLTIGVADATAVIGFSPLSLIKKVRLVLNGEDGIKIFDGKIYWIQNKLDSRVAGEKVAPGLTIGVQPFSGALKVHFELPKYSDFWKEITRLNSALLTELTLEILFGDAEDLVTPDATTTLAISGCKVEVWGLEYPDPEAQKVYSIFKETTKKKVITAQDDDFRMEITSKNPIASILILARDNSLDDDDIINKVTAVIDGTDYRRGFIDWDTVKEETKEFYGIAPETGVACLIFDTDKNMKNILRLAGTGSFELVFDVNAPTGVADIQLLIREVIPYAG